MFVRRLLGVLTVAGFLIPGVVLAQSATTGAIAGVARDATGAVLPGVTVEAASPALIEKVRTAVTDGQGNYRIVDLRPGTYSVTFTLPGFGTYKREGIELTTGFTATANGEMKVGAVEETVTVTSASPIVDIQNTRQQTVLSRQVLDSVPSNQTLQAFAALTLGAKLSAAGSQDVGGNQGETEGGFGVHGGRPNDQMYTMDGMRFLGADSAASARHFMVNQVFVQEVTLETKGISAESETGGVQVNVVPKEGSNVFRGNAAVNGTGSALQGENLSDELRARGLTGTPSVKKIWDFGGGFGGPVKQNKLWFYTAHRFWGTQNYAPANFYNKNAGKYVGRSDSGVTLYEPDLSRPAYIDIYNEDHSARFTWQATAKDKINFSNSTQRNCNCNWNVDRLPLAPEASLRHLYSPVNLTLASWNRPVTNRLLLEAGVMNLIDIWKPSRNEAVARNDRAILELSTGYQYNYQIFGNVVDNGRVSKPQTNGRFSLSYVTGSHGFKAGATYMRSAVETKQDINDPPLSYQFFNGSPVQLQQWASPIAVKSILNPVMALYAQDQWTLRRMTLNLGVRYDYFRGSSGAQSLAAGPFVPAREFAARKDIPNWKDIDPRLGVAFDLSGNGATALKLSVGRAVVAGVSGAATDPNNPANLVARSATRTWNDVNRDYFPDCNLNNPALNGECGASSTSQLGQPVVINRWADDVLKGFGNRIYNWQVSATMQHEIRPGFGVNVGYYRMWYGNFSITDNLAVTPTNYDPYCVTAPTDTRLGSASGQPICDLYDLNPSKLGQIDNVVTQASNYGERTEVYNGFEVGTRLRFGMGGLVQGGLSSGRTVEDNCTVIDSPQTLGWQSTANTPMRPSFCKVTMPFKGQTQGKIAVSYPLAAGFSASATYQSLPGVPIAANLSVTSAQVAGSLGRNLSLGTATVPLIEPNTMFEDRLSQLDLRFTRNFRFGHANLKGMFDVYNLLNGSTVLGLNTTYGAAWLRPITILAPRLFKFGAQFDF